MTTKTQITKRFKIEKNIACPAPTYNVNLDYPFSSMKVGDSFSFSHKEKPGVVAAAFRWGKKLRMQFSVRGLRVWRTQ